MNKEWIHTTHKIDPYEKKFRIGNVRNLPKYLNDHYIGIIYFLLSIAAFFCLSAVGYKYYKKKTEIKFITAEVYSGSIGNIRDQIYKNYSFSSMTLKEKKLYADRVEFIISEITKYNPDTFDAKKIAQQIAFQSYKANYEDPLFVTAIISAESSFKLTAKSHVGARGLMQLMPATAEDVCKNQNIEWKGKNELDDPEYNIFLGINYLKELHEFYGTNLERILIAYNWGPGHLNRALARGGALKLPKETMDYKRRVLDRHARFKKGFEEWQKNGSKKDTDSDQEVSKGKK